MMWINLSKHRRTDNDSGDVAATVRYLKEPGIVLESIT